jgi:DNA-binding LytR/AlgR family response regulator
MSVNPAANPPARFRTLVVEDEWPARNYLVELLEASHLAEVVGAVSTIEEARQVLTDPGGELRVDVAFVDVRIVGSGDEAGLELVRSMASGPSAPMFVLATAYRQHAVEAFELGVVDYLLKPFTEERVQRCLERLVERRPTPAPERPARIVARQGKKLVFLDPGEVWAFEASDRLTSVHTVHGQFALDLSLAAIEASIGRGFLRVHRSWLVSSSYIRELERDGSETRLFVGSGLGPEQPGIFVPVARERAQAVRELLLANSTGVRRG